MYNDEKEKSPENNQRPQYYGRFGYLCFAPDWLQWLNNPWCFLLAVSLLTFGQALSVLGLLAVIMPQLEKRFNFSSFDVGMIAASNDVAAVVFGLIISHYGHFGNKVRWIGVGGIVAGVGFIIFTLPHYIIEGYNPPPVSWPALLCTPPTNATNSGDCDEGEIAEWYYLAILLIGQFIAGVGTISLFSLTPAVFQECATDRVVAVLIGLWQGSVFVGPMVAFGVSEPLLELYVDIHPPEELNLTPKDPRWIGNWWVGILGSAFVCLLAAVFILGFPEKVKPQKEKTSTGPTIQSLTAKEIMLEFPSALKRLFTNWAFIFNSLGTNCTLMYAEGLAPFIAKILILRFGVEPEKVGNALTISTIPPLIIGVLFGALLTSAFKIENSGRKSALFCFICQLFTIVGPMAFIVDGCNEINLAGWQVPYSDRAGTPLSGIQLGSTCNSNCGCDLGIALPVCGSDNITYLSPCYAGCGAATSLTTFGNCSCVNSTNPFGGTAKIGNCDQECKNWLLFLVLMAVVSLAVFIQLTPAKVVLMRCIRPSDLSFAFGVQYISTKLLAHIPGPILFGHVVDFNCVIWQEVCDKTGYCWVYDMDAKMKMVTTIAGILAGLGMIFYMLSWILYKDADREMQDQINVGFDNKGLRNESDETKF